MGIHGFVADRKSGNWREFNSSCFRMPFKGMAIACQVLEVAAILAVMRVLFHPAKSVLRIFQGSRILHRLISRRQAINCEAHAVKLLSVGVKRRSLSGFRQTPIEPAI